MWGTAEGGAVDAVSLLNLRRIRSRFQLFDITKSGLFRMRNSPLEFIWTYFFAARCFWSQSLPETKRSTMKEAT